MLLRQQGRAAWVRFNRALAENRLPHKEVFDGVLIIFGGALLITPGFLTDILGLILLIPPTRALVRRLSSRLVRRRLALGGGATMWTFGRAQGRLAGAPAPGRARAAAPEGHPRTPSAGRSRRHLRRGEPARVPTTSRARGRRSETRTSCPRGREPFGG